MRVDNLREPPLESFVGTVSNAIIDPVCDDDTNI
jgi:hypothetical protein